MTKYTQQMLRLWLFLMMGGLIPLQGLSASQSTATAQATSGSAQQKRLQQVSQQAPQQIDDATQARIVAKLRAKGFYPKVIKEISIALWHPKLQLYQMMDQQLRSYFLSADLTQILVSDLYEFSDEGRLINIAEQQRSQVRAIMLDAVAESSMIIFKPEQSKAVVYVFSDIDCGYCRKLHQQMDEYLAYGIEIRYLAYPRAGMGSPSFDKAVAVWCSEHRQQAMTMAKNGKKVIERSCDHPVAEHFMLGNRIGVAGTPAIFFHGQSIPGYVPPAKLAQYLGLSKFQ